MDRFDTPELVARETGHVIEQEAYLHLIRTAEVLTARPSRGSASR